MDINDTAMGTNMDTVSVWLVGCCYESYCDCCVLCGVWCSFVVFIGNCRYYLFMVCVPTL